MSSMVGAVSGVIHSHVEAQEKLPRIVTPLQVHDGAALEDDFSVTWPTEGAHRFVLPICGERATKKALIHSQHGLYGSSDAED